MPELPEVETIRRGLEPYLVAARIVGVTLNRPNLRFPFPAHLAKNLQDQTIVSVGRRAKYLLIGLAGGQTVLSHLGMTGAYRFADRALEKPPRYYEIAPVPKHDHMIWRLEHHQYGESELIYTDPRRFGFVDFYGRGETSPYLEGLGPEPLGNEFNAQMLADAFKTKKAPIKAALLDQRVVAGLGNIYVAEALFRAHIAPTVPALSLVERDGTPKPSLILLASSIVDVLSEAVGVGGSTLKDFRNAQGETGYFQHQFSVYDRAGEPCPTPGCKGTIARMVQAGRATFYCPVCQGQP